MARRSRTSHYLEFRVHVFSNRFRDARYGNAHASGGFLAADQCRQFFSTIGVIRRQSQQFSTSSIASSQARRFPSAGRSADPGTAGGWGPGPRPAPATA